MKEGRQVLKEAKEAKELLKGLKKQEILRKVDEKSKVKEGRQVLKEAKELLKGLKKESLRKLYEKLK